MVKREPNKEPLKVIPEDKKLGIAIDTVLRTEAGQLLWAHIAKKCGMFESSLSRNPQTGEINPLGTEAQEAQRFFYLELRKLATPGLLRTAEVLADTPAVPVSAVQTQERGEKK